MSKKSKHARNQAKYMERKREAGLEWLAVWVPEPAYHAFKTIAKAARKSHDTPTESQLAQAVTLAARTDTALPEWATSSAVLLSVWMASVTASSALDHAQAEREAARGRKAKAKAARTDANDGDEDEDEDQDDDEDDDRDRDETAAAPSSPEPEAKAEPAAPAPAEAPAPKPRTRRPRRPPADSGTPTP